MSRLFSFLTFLIGLISFSSITFAQEFDGKLDWWQKTPIKFGVSGTVKQVNVQPGQKIPKGAPMMSLNPQIYKAALDEARSVLKTKKRQLTDAKKDWGRIKELYDRQVLALTEYEAAQMRYNLAKDEYNIAKAKLQKAQFYYQESIISAPFESYVIHNSTVPGQVIISDLQLEPLMTIVSANNMIAKTFISEEIINKLHVSDSANVIIGEKTFRGKIYNLGVEVANTQDNKNYYELHVLFPVQRIENFRSGQGAMIEIPNL